MNSRRLTNKEITEAACGLGFSACGVIPLRAVDDATVADYKRWIDKGHNASMEYLKGYEDIRFDPRLLMPEAKVMMCLAMSYVPDSSMPLSPQGYSFAAYALGKDYHDVVKGRLRQLAEQLCIDSYRAFCDTAPIMERYWAQQAGIGWIGRNRQLIIPGAGSMFFLGEILADIEVDAYGEPMQRACGACRRCIEACPTHALGEGDGDFDASLCLSYQTIENRGDIPAALAEKMGDCIYGCDRCQQACPYNRHLEPTAIEEFRPSEELRSMTRGQWQSLTIEQYRALFKGSAVKRAKYEGLMRNIKLL